MDPGYAHASKNVAKNSVFTFVNASKTGVHLPGLLSTSFLFYLPISRTERVMVKPSTDHKKIKEMY